MLALEWARNERSCRGKDEDVWRGLDSEVGEVQVARTALLATERVAKGTFARQVEQAQDKRGCLREENG